MIKISGSVIDYEIFIKQHSLEGVQGKIIDILASSNEVYKYSDEDQLLFELNSRQSIIKSAIELYRSNFSFKVFRKSKCNEEYWHRTEEGGFRLNDGVSASKGIKDIYLHSSKYGTECSTAMVIVFYKALLDVLPEELYNKLFSEIYLMNWQHIDSKLDVVNYRDPSDYLPGDCRYFKNPDVDPLTPEWQGENAIDLGNGMYYGHGIGIKTDKKIIEVLNKERKDGAEKSAYLLDSATRPGFKLLADEYKNYILGTHT